MRTYNTISEIKEANKVKGHHYFEPDTMRFFKSKVYPEIIHGNLFITSEKHREDDPRLFSVRCAMPDGSIDSVSKFQAFETKAQAIRYAKRLPVRIQEAIECAQNEFNTGKKKGMGFVSHALIEPSNNSDGSYSMGSFAGACTWLIQNYKETDLSWIEKFANEYNERFTEV